MDACAGQEDTELVALLQGALDWVDFLLVFVLFLLLLSDNNPSFKHFHDLEELIKGQPGLVIKLLLGQ